MLSTGLAALVANDLSKTIYIDRGDNQKCDCSTHIDIIELVLIYLAHITAVKPYQHRWQHGLYKSFRDPG